MYLCILDGAVIPFDRQCICTGNDHQIGIGLIFLDRPDFGRQLFRRHHGLAFQVATPLGRSDVDVKASDTGPLKPFQGVQRIQGVAVPGIEIRNYRKVDRIDNLLEAFGDLCRIDQPHIGIPVLRAIPPPVA